MAFKVNKIINVGYELPELYVRFSRIWVHDERIVDAWISVYPSEAAYLAHPLNEIKEVPNLDRQYQFKKDPAADLLTSVHDKVKEILTTDVTEEREFTTTDAKGNTTTKTETVVIREKFCEPEEIVIDLKTKQDDTERLS